MTHIVYGIDDKYLPCLLVSMFSALDKTSVPTKVTVFTAGKAFDLSVIHQIAGHFPHASLEIRLFEPDELAGYGKTDVAQRFPPVSLLPLFIPWLIDDKCLFLDADTLVLQDIRELYGSDLRGCLIGATQAYPAALSVQKHFPSKALSLGSIVSLWPTKKRKKLQRLADDIGFTIEEIGTKFISSGVIIFDTQAIRRADPSKVLIDIKSSDHRHRQTMPDMERLNEFFKDRVCYLDLKWDVPKDILAFNKIYTPPHFWAQVRAAIQDPGILHFSNIFGRKSWRRPWYKQRHRYRLYSRACQDIEARTGVPIIQLFDSRM